MTSTLSLRRDLETMDRVGWSMVGIEDDGPGWDQYMRDDEHPRFMREYRALQERLHNGEDEPTWH